MGGPVNDNETQNLNQNNSSSSANTEIYEIEEQSGSITAPPFSISSSGASQETKASDGKGQKEGDAVKMPFDMESVLTAKQAKDSLGELRTNGYKVLDVINNSEDIVGDIGGLELETKNTLLLTGKIWKKYDNSAELEQEDKEELSKLATQFETHFTPNFDTIKNAAKSKYNGIAGFKPIDSQSKEIQNAMHEAYKNSDAGMIKNISELIEAMDGYNSKGKEMGDLAKDIIPDLNNSKLMKQLDGYSGKMTSLAEKGSEVLEVAQHLNTVYDNVGNAGSDLSGPVKGLESTFFFVDKAINLVDLPGLNFIQSLWNNVYKPMIDVCINGLGEIANLKEKGFEDITRAKITHWDEKHLDNENLPPSYYRSTIERLEGGWNLFYFMWNVMCSERDRLPSDAAVKYFEDNYDRINEGTVSELPYNGIVDWEIKPSNLMFWALGEKHHLWAMFYGTVLPYPPKTKN